MAFLLKKLATRLNFMLYNQIIARLDIILRDSLTFNESEMA